MESSRQPSVTRGIYDPIDYFLIYTYLIDRYEENMVDIL